MLKKEEKCNYPGCIAKSTCAHQLQLTNEKDSSVNLPFCEYHKFIVAGGRFTAAVIRTPAIEPTEKEPKGTPEQIDFEIQGPLLEVEMAQQVCGAIEFIRNQKKEK